MTLGQMCQTCEGTQPWFSRDRAEVAFSLTTEPEGHTARTEQSTTVANHSPTTSLRGHPHPLQLAL